MTSIVIEDGDCSARLCGWSGPIHEIRSRVKMNVFGPTPWEADKRRKEAGHERNMREP